jgi:hypothetical protein
VFSGIPTHLFHRFFVVIDKIDDLPMLRRKCGQTLSQRVTGILLLHCHFRIVGRILDRVGGLFIEFNALLRRSTERALNGVIAKSQVETADRPSNLPA